MKYLEQETMWRKATTSTGTPCTLLEFQSTVCDNDLSSIISFPSIILYLTFIYILVWTMILPVLYTYILYAHSFNYTIVIRYTFLDSSFLNMFCGENAIAMFNVENLHEKWIRTWRVPLFIARFKIIGCQRHTPFTPIDASSAIFYGLNIS